MSKLTLSVLKHSLQNLARSPTVLLAITAVIAIATGKPYLTTSARANSGTTCQYEVTGTTVPNTSGTPLLINNLTGTVISANFFNSGAIDPIEGDEFVSVCIHPADQSGNVTAEITTNVGLDDDAQIKGYPEFIFGTKFGNQYETSYRYYSNNNLTAEQKWPVLSQNNSANGQPFELANLEYVSSVRNLNLPAFTSSLPTIEITLDIDESNVVGAERDIMLESWFHDTSANSNILGLNAANGQPLAGTLNNIVGIGHPHYNELDNTLLEMMVHIGALSPNDVSGATRNPGQNQLTEIYSGKDFDGDGIDDHFDVDSHVNQNNNQEPRPGIYSSGIDDDGDGIDDADILPITIGSFQYSIWYGTSFLAPIVIFSRETDQSLQNDFDPSTPDMDLSAEGEFTLLWNDFLDYTLNHLEQQLQTAQVSWATGTENPFPKMRAAGGAISGVELGVEPQTNIPADLPYSILLNKFDLKVDGKTFGLVDGNKPTITTTYPGQFDLIAPATTSVTGTAIDDSSGIDQVMVLIRRDLAATRTYWNGSAWQETEFWLDATVNNDDWSVDNVDLSEDGNYRTYTRAYDVAGNHASESVNPVTDFIVLDNRPGFTGPTSPLTSTTAAFSWTNNDGIVTDYWLYLGASLGSNNLYDSKNLQLSESITAANLPTNGSTLFARLWYKLNGSPDWYFTDAEFISFNQPQITSHYVNDFLSPFTDNFSWQQGWDSYWLYVGSSVGAADYFNSGNLGTATNVAATGLPNDGISTVYVRLWYRQSTEPWSFVDYSYLSGLRPAIVTPSELQPIDSSETFSWVSNNNAVVTSYWLYLGSTTGDSDIYDSGNLQLTNSLAISGLPTNGSTIHSRLWYQLSGSAVWYFTDQEFTTKDTPSITSHNENDTLSPNSDTFTWDTGWDEYWLYAGSSTGASDYFDSGNLTSSTTSTATGLPDDGSSTVYVRLWFRLSGNAWESADFSYVAGSI